MTQSSMRLEGTIAFEAVYVSEDEATGRMPVEGGILTLSARFMPEQ